jgi:serine/threonine protein phosphatase PrpC
VTDIGLLRQRNEDAFAVKDLGRAGVVAVVCDGVSASASPHLAARLGARALLTTLVDGVAASKDPDDAMFAAFDDALDAVGRIIAEDAPVRGAPASTAVAALWDGTVVTIGWVGDSRAYWVSDRQAARLTADDTWAEEQVAAGAQAPEVAFADPRAHAITRWLGADAPPTGPSVQTFRPRGRGRMVICSDGLWNYLPAAADLATLVARHPGAGPLDLARSLVVAALVAGGHDNVTVAVLDIDPDPGPVPEPEPPEEPT